MPKLMIFNREEEYIGDVKDIIQASQKLEINGEDSLTIETLDNRLEKGYRILYHDRDADKFYEYIIQEKEEHKSGKTIIIDIYADNSISELIGDYIEDKRSINQFASHAIERALEGTRWNMGRFYNGWRGTVTFYRTNARAAIAAIMDEWQLEMETEIEFDKESGKIKRTLHLVYERGQFRNNKLTYTRDIVDIKRKTLPRDIITALYGYGKGERTESGGYGRRIDFSEINNGKAYVENNEAKELWGRVGKDGNKIHTFAKVEFESIEDKQLLLERTQSELDKLSKPAVSYEISILDFFRLSKSKHNYIELGDTVRVLDRDFTPQINFNTRVIEITRDLVNIENTKIVLGETVKNIADRESEQDKKIEEANSELPYWEEEDDDDWDPGGLPEYERASAMIKAFPRLKIGLSSWIDANEPNSLLMNNERVGVVKDAISNEIVYSQSIDERSPTIKVADGRRFLSFNPDPMVMNRWEGGKSDRPSDLIKQNGEFMNHVNSGHDIKSIFIIYIDRTPEKIGEGFGAENYFRAGTSCPIGHPFSHLKKVKERPYTSIVVQLSDEVVTEDQVNGFNNRPDDRDRLIQPFVRRFRRNQLRIYNHNTKIGESLNIMNIGMNKESYDDYIAYNITGRDFADTSNREGLFYEMNAFFTGEIAEIILHTRELDSEERALLQEYATNKYGL